MNILDKLGIKKEEKKPDFLTLLFYFMKEFKFNPLDEEYILPNGKIIIKKGLSQPLYNGLLVKMQEHYEREKAEYNKAKR